MCCQNTYQLVFQLMNSLFKRIRAKVFWWDPALQFAWVRRLLLGAFGHILCR